MKHFSLQIIMVLMAPALLAAAEKNASIRHLLTSLPALEKSAPTPPRWPIENPDYIVLDFWASWCEPCRDSAPFLNQLSQIWKSKNVLWLSLNEDPDPEDGRKFLKDIASQESAFLHLHDTDRKLANFWQIDSLPRVYILNSKFELIWLERGFTVDKRKKIEAKFQELLKPNSPLDKDPGQRSTDPQHREKLEAPKNFQKRISK